MKAVAFFALLVSGAFGWGALLRRRLIGDGAPNALRLAFDLALGLGILTLGTLGLALLGWATPGVLWGWLLIIGLSGGVGWRGFRPPARSLGAILLGIVFLANLVACLAPPASYDALTYHLAVPRLYLEAGRVFEQADNVQSYSRGPVHFLFLLALGTAGEPAVACLVALTNLGLLGALLGAARAAGLGRTAWIAPLACFAMPFFPLFAKNPEIDLALAFFLVLTLAALQEWRRGGRAGALVLTGLLAGLACGTKYTGFLVLPVLAAARLAGGPRVGRARDGAILFASALAVEFPLLALNAVWTGNPLYPYFPGLFGGAPTWHGQAPDPGAMLSWKVLVLPWTLSVADLRIGPLFAIFLPALARTRVRDTIVAPALGLAAFALPALFYLCPAYWTWSLSRFAAPFLIPLCVGVALGCDALFRAGGAWRAAAVGFLALNVLVSGALFCAATARRLPVVVGRETREAFLARELPDWHGWKFINQHIPPAALVGLVEPLGYYVRSPYLYLQSYHVDFDLARMADAADFHRALRARRVDYLALATDRGDNNTLPFWEFAARHPDLLSARRFERVYADRAFEVYRVLPPD